MEGVQVVMVRYGRIGFGFGLGGRDEAKFVGAAPFLASDLLEACRVGASPRQDHGKANRRFGEIKSRVEGGHDAKLEVVVGDANEETSEGVVDTGRWRLDTSNNWALGRGATLKSEEVVLLI